MREPCAHHVGIENGGKAIPRGVLIASLARAYQIANGEHDADTVNVPDAAGSPRGEEITHRRTHRMWREAGAAGIALTPSEARVMRNALTICGTPFQQGVVQALRAYLRGIEQGE